jgi:hypothetical protein
MTILGLRLVVLPDRLALCRLPARDAVPEWTRDARAFLTITRTPTELSIIADEAAVPSDVGAHRGYRALGVEGPIPLELVGVMASIAAPLAAAGVSIIPIGTFDTDYVLVLETALGRATQALLEAGHEIRST